MTRALAALARAAHDEKDKSSRGSSKRRSAGVTHGEIVGLLRKELGFGRPLIVI